MLGYPWHVAHNPDRESFFPKIEKKHGQPMKYWFAVMKDLDGLKYPEQIAYLKEEHGFSQAHANALVMYSRGSKSSKRFDTIDEFLKKESPAKKKAVKAIFKAIQKLPESQQTAFLLSFVEGLPRQEVAEVMNTSLKAVESLLHRAKQNLRNELDSFYNKAKD